MENEIINHSITISGLTEEKLKEFKNKNNITHDT
jgi:hypothetical protein